MVKSMQTEDIKKTPIEIVNHSIEKWTCYQMRSSKNAATFMENARACKMD